MNLPQIDISAVPDLSVMTGVFGSVAHKAILASDDTMVIIITFLYDVLHP
jgi:hypothetical protein